MRNLNVKEVSLNEVMNLTPEQGASRYNIGIEKLRAAAEDAGAIIRAGKKILYSRPILDDWFINHAE